MQIMGAVFLAYPLRVVGPLASAISEHNLKLRPFTILKQALHRMSFKQAWVGLHLPTHS